MMSRTFNDTIEKVYFQISEVSTILGVHSSCIRYWLDVFDLEVMRKRGDKRFFTEENIADLKEIHRLLKVEGYTISGAKRRFREYKMVAA